MLRAHPAHIAADRLHAASPGAGPGALAAVGDAAVAKLEPRFKFGGFRMIVTEE